MKRNRGYYRMQRKRAIGRKLRIVKSIWAKDGYEYAVKMPGRYHKGKIHCSCWMCSQKSSEELTARDKREVVRATQKLLDWKQSNCVSSIPSREVQ